VQTSKSDKETMVIEGAFPSNDLPDDSMMLENTIVSKMPEDRSIVGKIRTKE
jgi:hypothetical protein